MGLPSELFLFLFKFMFVDDRAKVKFIPLPVLSSRNGWARALSAAPGDTAWTAASRETAESQCHACADRIATHCRMSFSHAHTILVSEQPVFLWPLSTVFQSRHLHFLFSWSLFSGVRRQRCLGAGCQLAEGGGPAPSSSLSVLQDAYPGGQKTLLPLCFSSTRQMCMKTYSSCSLKERWF